MEAKGIEKVSQAVFDAMHVFRDPMTVTFYDEQEWFIRKDRQVLGLVLRDRVDHDYSFVLFTQGPEGVFVAGDLGINFSHQDGAVSALQQKMECYT
jgi:hypothetical protein